MTSAALARCVPVATVASPAVGELLQLRTNHVSLGSHLCAVFGPPRDGAAATPTLDFEHWEHPWPRWVLRAGDTAPRGIPSHALFDQLDEAIAARIARLGYLVVAGASVVIGGRAALVVTSDAQQRMAIAKALADHGCRLVSHGSAVIGPDCTAVPTLLPVLVGTWAPWWPARPAPVVAEIGAHGQFVPITEIDPQAVAERVQLHAVVEIVPGDTASLENLGQAQTALSVLSAGRGDPSMPLVEELARSAIGLRLSTAMSDAGTAVEMLIEALT